MRKIALICGLMLALAWGVFGNSPPVASHSKASAADKSTPDFDREIAPLLAHRCAECHNADEHKGGLDLTSKAKALAGGDSGRAIAAGNAKDSLLWQRVGTNEMPPKHPLSAAEKSLVKRWLMRAPLGAPTASIRCVTAAIDARATTGGRCSRSALPRPTRP